MAATDGSGGQNADKPGFIDGAIEKSGDFVDDKTHDKYASQVDKGQDFLSDKYGKSDTSDESHDAPRQGN